MANPPPHSSHHSNPQADQFLHENWEHQTHGRNTNISLVMLMEDARTDSGFISIENVQKMLQELCKAMSEKIDVENAATLATLKAESAKVKIETRIFEMKLEKKP
ncbi:hypothetical protein GcM1_245072 [Golovinomyces cichoracearum]|uniref:Uncharacterized protein n=1 Tax=Golovinomyces cichoracearum TaxID=62708 RepID=A0A420IF34_9PEZI|nr:hypothetical protein GcM1_245072 [Golovinomyces cichoracearum]